MRAIQGTAGGYAVGGRRGRGGLWESKEEFILLFGDPEEEVVVVRFELAALVVSMRNRSMGILDNPGVRGRIGGGNDGAM